MFIKRDLEAQVRLGMKQMPIVAVVGPRQSGKSTFLRNAFPEYTYLDMQDADLFDFASKDPKGFLRGYGDEKGVIIDEAQYVPSLFSQLKVEVCEQYHSFLLLSILPPNRETECQCQVHLEICACRQCGHLCTTVLGHVVLCIVLYNPQPR